MVSQREDAEPKIAQIKRVQLIWLNIFAMTLLYYYAKEEISHDPRQGNVV
jgi:hypothetical protein